MKRFILFSTALIMALSASFFTAVTYAENNVSTQSREKILFLPFSNYTDSDMKYLSVYIPELLKKNFKSDGNLLPVEVKDIPADKKGNSFKSDIPAEKELLLPVMKEAGIVMCVTGRYLIQGQTVIIETGLLKSDGQYITAPVFEGKIDESFFKHLTDYAEDKIKWIRGDILHENIHTDIVEQHDIAFRFVKILKDAGLSSLKKGWFLALIIVILFYLLSMTVSTILIKLAERFSSRTSTDIDDLIIALAKKPLKFIIVLAGVRVALLASDIKSAFGIFAGKFITAMILIALAYIASGILGIFIRSWGERIADRVNPRINNDLVPLFERTMKVIVFSVVVMLILSSFDIDVAPLVASLGIAGFAIGFAVKDTLSNIIGGIILILDNSFSVGDKVTIDDDTGIVKEVGLRNTKILTYDNEMIIIPNGELMNKKIQELCTAGSDIACCSEFWCCLWFGR